MKTLFSTILFSLFMISSPLYAAKTTQQTDTKISPDGSTLSYLAPSKNNVLNIWIQPKNNHFPAKKITHARNRSIKQYFWTDDGKHILYIQDKDNDQTDHLYMLNISTGLTRDLTPFEGVRATNIIMDQNFPDEILVGLNIRQKNIFDMYRIHLSTGALTLDTKNTGHTMNWATDEKFQIRAALIKNQNGTSSIQVRNSTVEPWKTITTWPQDESGQPLGFNEKGDELLTLRTLKDKTSKLVQLNTQTGKVAKTLAEHKNSMIQEILINPNTDAVEAVFFKGSMPEWQVLDTTLKPDFTLISTQLKRHFAISSRSNNDNIWIITTQAKKSPIKTYLLDRKAKKLDRLFAS